MEDTRHIALHRRTVHARVAVGPTLGRYVSSTTSLCTIMMNMNVGDTSVAGVKFTLPVERTRCWIPRRAVSEDPPASSVTRYLGTTRFSVVCCATGSRTFV